METKPVARSNAGQVHNPDRFHYKFSYSVALQPVDEPVTTIPHKVIYEEYAVRYLESQGIRPTKANLELVKLKMPLSSLKMTAAWRCRGWSSDQITVSNTKPSYKLDPHFVPTDQDVLTSNQPNQEGVFASGVENGNSLDEDEDLPTMLRSDYISPQKPALDDNDTSATRLDKQSQPEVKLREMIFQNRVKKYAEMARQHRLQRMEAIQEHQAKKDSCMLAELQKPPRVTLRFVIDTLKTYFEKLVHNRQERYVYSRKDLNKAVSLFTSPKVAQLICLVIHFCYWSTHGQNAKESLSEKEIANICLAIKTAWFEIDEDFRKMKGYTLFLLPMYLHCLRYVIRASFRQNFPVWMSSRAHSGKVFEAKVAELVDSLFDPDYHLEHCTVKQPFVGKRASTSLSAQRGGAQLSELFHATSPYVKLLFPKASSVGARQLMSTSVRLQNRTKPHLLDEFKHKSQYERLLKLDPYRQPERFDAIDSMKSTRDQLYKVASRRFSISRQNPYYNTVPMKRATSNKYVTDAKQSKHGKNVFT